MDFEKNLQPLNNLKLVNGTKCMFKMTVAL